MNFKPTEAHVKKETLNPTGFKFDMSALEKKIEERGIAAEIERKKLKSEKDRNLFISLYNKPAIVAFNTKTINTAQNLTDLIQSIKVNKINIISADNITGDFNLYNNKYLLEELNFIDKYLGSKVINSDKQDTENVELAKNKARGLTRSCGLRYKVRDLLMGII